MNIQLINSIANANNTHDVYAFLHQARSIIIEDYIGTGMNGEAMCRMALLKTNQEIQNSGHAQAQQAMQIIGQFCNKLEYAIKDLEDCDTDYDYYMQLEEMAGRA